MGINFNKQSTVYKIIQHSIRTLQAEGVSDSLLGLISKMSEFN